MLRAFSGSYPSNIHYIRDACQKYCEENKLDGLTELHELLFDRRSRKDPKSRIKREIYQLCTKSVKYSSFLKLLHEALIIEQFTFAPVEHTEIVAIKKWLSNNQKDYIEMEKIFHRPTSLLSKLINRFTDTTSGSNREPLDNWSEVAYKSIKYRSKFVYVRKGKPLPSKYLHSRLYSKKLSPRAREHIRSFEGVGKVAHFRYWTANDYKILFDFTLAKSHQVLLDRPPCEHGIRYLSFPVNQFYLTIEYMVRLFYLFVYFIDELPTDLTMRSFLEFLRQKLVVEQEEIPYFCYPMSGTNNANYEFCGFARGNTATYTRFSPELDEEVFQLNEIVIPPDEELIQILDEENNGGCQLIRAAQYAGIIEGDVERSEELRDEPEWGEWQKKEKLRKKLNRSRKPKRGDRNDLPPEYDALMNKDKAFKKKKKEKLRKKPKAMKS